MLTALIFFNLWKRKLSFKHQKGKKTPFFCLLSYSLRTEMCLFVYLCICIFHECRSFGYYPWLICFLKIWATRLPFPKTWKEGEGEKTDERASVVRENPGGESQHEPVKCFLQETVRGQNISAELNQGKRSVNSDGESWGKRSVAWLWKINHLWTQ